jgi:hypothetical protein
VSRRTPKLVENSDSTGGVQTINRKNEIEKFLGQGKMKVDWLSDEYFKEFILKALVPRRQDLCCIAL